mgnify:CR=1 FL=1
MTAAEASSSLEQSESHRRMKRWAQYGNKVWNDTIRIGYANYLDSYERLEQDQVLKECTDVSIQNTVIISRLKLHLINSWYNHI